MHIFNKQNRHGWRAKLAIFFVVAIFAGVTYFAQLYLGTSKTVIAVNKIQTEEDISPVQSLQEENSQTEKDEQVTVVEDVLPDQENKNVEKVDTPLPVIDRDKNPATRLEEAKIYAQPQIIMGKYIDISLKHQNMVIFEDGKPLDAFLISSGMKGLNTPTGTFKIENKYPRAWSKDYFLWMPYWMAFLPTGKMGIHELPEWPGGYKEPGTHLGTPVSHGCVRLGVGPAKQVYDWAEIGTPVIIHK